MTRSPAADDFRALRASVLEALSDLPRCDVGAAAELARALHTLEGEAWALPPRWWVDLDLHTRRTSRWLIPDSGGHSAATDPLPAPWRWALEVCAANGRTREAALDEHALPYKHPALLPLLVVRCSDWAKPVREHAAAVLDRLLAGAEGHEKAQACATAWACESRRRGGTAVHITAAHLEGDDEVWRHLFACPDHLTRRRALTEALHRDALTAHELVNLVLTDTDVVVGLRATEHVLLWAFPPGGAAAPIGAQALEDRLLTARIPQVRAAAVTVLHRAQRPDLATPFLTDRSAMVRESARWVLRSHHQDPATVCRERLTQLAHPDRPVTPGVVSGLAECGDRADARWVRAQLTLPVAKVRAAALRALNTLEPLPVEDLIALMDRDPSPGVLRVATQALLPAAHRIPRPRLDAWLVPGQPRQRRVNAAKLLRAGGIWNRLEADLRLLNDTDPNLARDARNDLHAVMSIPTTGYQQVPATQLALLLDLLDSADGTLDKRTTQTLRFTLAAAHHRS